MAGRVTHFEIYGDDPRGLAKFYHHVLGWPIERAEGVDYWRIQLGPDNGQNASGGVTYRPSVPVGGWLQYVQVESLDVAVAKAEHAGGRVLRERTAVPRTAWYAVLADPEGNVFAMWQPDPAAFPLRNRTKVQKKTLKNSQPYVRIPEPSRGKRRSFFGP